MSEVSTWQLSGRFGFGGKITQYWGRGGIYSKFCSQRMFLALAEGIGATLDIVLPNVCEYFPNPQPQAECEFQYGGVLRMKTVTFLFIEVTFVDWALNPGGTKHSWYPAIGFGLGYFELEWRLL